jgi:hypothetical protein
MHFSINVNVSNRTRDGTVFFVSRINGPMWWLCCRAKHGNLTQSFTYKVFNIETVYRQLNVRDTHVIRIYRSLKYLHTSKHPDFGFSTKKKTA